MWQHKRATADAQGYLNIGTWSLQWSLWSVNHGCFKAAVALNLQLEENQNAIKSFSQNLTIQQLSATGHVFCHHATLSFQNSMTDGRWIKFCFTAKMYSGNFRAFDGHNEQCQWGVIIILYVDTKNLDVILVLQWSSTSDTNVSWWHGAHISKIQDYIPFFLDEKLWYEIFGLIRNISKFLIFKIPVTGQDIVEGLIVIITQKRRQSSEAEVKRNMFSPPVFPSSCTWSPMCQLRLFCHSGLSYKILLSKKVSRPFPFSYLLTRLNNHPSSLTHQALLSFMVSHIF